MANLNKVFLMGNLTRPPELRYTPSGTAVADLRLAVNRNYTTQGGEKREETCFLTVVVWGKQAESCGEYLDKGSPILVEGRLQTRDWETKDGQKRNVVEVVAERVQFMGRSKAPATAPGGPPEAVEAAAEAGEAQGLQVLHGQGAARRLQGRAPAEELRVRARQDHPAPNLGQLRPAPAPAHPRHPASAYRRAPSPDVGVGGAHEDHSHGRRAVAGPPRRGP